jgi:hypothetical protein
MASSLPGKAPSSGLYQIRTTACGAANRWYHNKLRLNDRRHRQSPCEALSAVGPTVGPISPFPRTIGTKDRTSGLSFARAGAISDSGRDPSCRWPTRCRNRDRRRRSPSRARCGNCVGCRHPESSRIWGVVTTTQTGEPQGETAWQAGRGREEGLRRLIALERFGGAGWNTVVARADRAGLGSPSGCHGVAGAPAAVASERGPAGLHAAGRLALSRQAASLCCCSARIAHGR